MKRPPFTLAAVTLAALAIGAVALAGCHRKEGAASKPAAQAAANSISGAGSTFAAPIIQQWAEAYQAHSGVGLNYQAIGSGGGIRQIQAATVDFGASDKPMKSEDLAKAGLYQFPTIIGGVVPAVNIPGVGEGQLKLTGPVLADIFLGAITRWDDPRIAGLNPGLKLPPTPITTVHRSDGSGTNFLFTSYLSSVSPAFASKVGASDSVSWPSGLGGKGNAGVAAFVKQTAGSIGYVEYAYAKQNRMAYAMLQNHDGHYPQPVAQNFAAAAAGADWAHAPGNYILLINEPGANAWPITGATFVLVHRQQTKPEHGAGVLKFFDWAFKNGDAAAAKLDYVPLPAEVKDMVRKQWTTEVKTADGKPVWQAGG
jgi:phosphate transport system substrate-binding protein